MYGKEFLNDMNMNTVSQPRYNLVAGHTRRAVIFQKKIPLGVQKIYVLIVL